MSRMSQTGRGWTTGKGVRRHMSGVKSTVIVTGLMIAAVMGSTGCGSTERPSRKQVRLDLRAAEELGNDRAALDDPSTYSQYWNLAIHGVSEEDCDLEARLAFPLQPIQRQVPTFPEGTPDEVMSAQLQAWTDEVQLTERGLIAAKIGCHDGARRIPSRMDSATPPLPSAASLPKQVTRSINVSFWNAGASDGRTVGFALPDPVLS